MSVERRGAIAQSGVASVWVLLLLVATGLAVISYRHQHVAGASDGLTGVQAEPVRPDASSASTASHSGDQSPVKVMTVLSGPYRMACDMLAGAVHNGITMHVIGWGSDQLNVKNFKKKEEKLKKKIPFLYEHVKGWPDDTILMFIDGGDVFWQNGIESVYTAYKQLATPERPIIFSAERNCWIRSLPKERCADWPKTPGTPYRYLNSGCWIGELGSVKRLLSYVNETVDKISAETCSKCGDQAIFGKAYIADGWNKTMQLDHHTTICQNLHMSQDDFCDEPTRTGRVRNCLTKREPALFHFNGNPRHPKLNPAKWKQKMWWHDRPVPHDAIVVVDGKDKMLRDLCPKLTYTPGGVSQGPSSATVQRPSTQHQEKLKRALSIQAAGSMVLVSLLGVALIGLICTRSRRRR
eukprot:TRINITY_DN16683_c0_g1_i1.p1 TRINITY_DN16683_c0_g1~~TRINITY_DN16683_c0_g1_i1.p1  ORF type:complete len:409 (+),score=101.99 TRINITY_DN16683_c0_g1_i1:45-1271(+)